MHMNGVIVKPDDLPSRLLVLRFIHLAMVAGVVMFGGVLFVITQGRMPHEPAFQNPICQAGIVLSGASVLLAANLHRIFFRLSSVPTDLTTAFQRYNVFFLMRAAVLECGALFAAVVTFMTQNILPFGLLIFGATALAFYRPSRGEFDRLLGGESQQEWQ